MLCHKARNSSAPDIGGAVFLKSFLTLNLETIIRRGDWDRVTIGKLVCWELRVVYFVFVTSVAVAFLAIGMVEIVFIVGLLIRTIREIRQVFIVAVVASCVKVLLVAHRMVVDWHETLLIRSYLFHLAK